MNNGITRTHYAAQVIVVQNISRQRRMPLAVADQRLIV